VPASGCKTLKDAGLDDILGDQGGLDEATVVAGLKEALKVGTERTVDQVGAVDGYLADEMLRIVLPEDARSAASTLRRVGMGGMVDEFEVSMNRAAELAAHEATAIFWNAITSMTLADAWGILRGNDTAATDYFRQRTGQALTSRYRPIVETKLRSVGGYSDYETLVGRLEAIPLVDAPDLDLVGYVTDHALEGLFSVLAGEEQKIREDPLKRTTSLLQRVFGPQ